LNISISKETPVISFENALTKNTTSRPVEAQNASRNASFYVVIPKANLVDGRFLKPTL
jgi:hypothetical protein